MLNAKTKEGLSLVLAVGSPMEGDSASGDFLGAGTPSANSGFSG